jgi:hypothetical protein
MEGTQNKAGDTIPESCKFYCKDFEKFQILLGSVGTLGAILLLTLLYYLAVHCGRGPVKLYIYILYVS